MRALAIFGLIYSAFFSGCGLFTQIQRDPVTAVDVISAERHTVAIFAGAKCGSLDFADSRGNGYFIDNDIIISVGHFYESNYPTGAMIFSVIDYSGKCFDGQVLKFHAKPTDVLFLKVRASHGPGLKLADERAKKDEIVFTYSYVPSFRKSYEPKNDAQRFKRVQMRVVATIFDHGEGGKRLGVRPIGIEGDSGSPLLNLRGEVVGMFQGIMPAKNEEPSYGVYISGHYIKKLLDACKTCK